MVFDRRDHPATLKDRDILAIATKERRVLLTNDRDFGELVFRRRMRHEGVVLLRFPSANIGAKLAGVLHAVAELERDPALFVVVEPGAVRVRRTER